MKRWVCMVLAIAMMMTAMMAFAENNGPQRGMGGGPNGERGGGRMGGGGQTDKSSDVQLQAMIAEVAPKFRLLTYEDTERARRCNISCTYRKTMTAAKAIPSSSSYRMPAWWAGTPTTC